MSQLHITSSSTIDAPAEEVYTVLADYHKAHQAILPKSYFTELTVEEGGTGAGTVRCIRMKVLGVESVYRMVVSEPEPGRVLVEVDENAGVTTTFTIDPISSSSRCRLTISTDMSTSPGIKGIFERLLSPSIIRRIYKQELRQIAGYMGTEFG